MKDAPTVVVQDENVLVLKWILRILKLKMNVPVAINNVGVVVKGINLIKEKNPNLLCRPLNSFGMKTDPYIHRRYSRHGFTIFGRHIRDNLLQRLRNYIKPGMIGPDHFVDI